MSTEFYYDRKCYYDNIIITSTYGVFDIDAANKDWEKYNNYMPYDLREEVDDLNFNFI